MRLDKLLNETQIKENLEEADIGDKCKCGGKIKKSYAEGTLICSDCGRYYKPKSKEKK